VVSESLFELPLCNIDDAYEFRLLGHTLVLELTQPIDDLGVDLVHRLLGRVGKRAQGTLRCLVDPLFTLRRRSRKRLESGHLVPQVGFRLIAELVDLMKVGIARNVSVRIARSASPRRRGSDLMVGPAETYLEVVVARSLVCHGAQRSRRPTTLGGGGRRGARTTILICNRDPLSTFARLGNERPETAT
jgi:hypothetical protein